MKSSASLMLLLAISFSPVAVAMHKRTNSLPDHLTAQQGPFTRNAHELDKEQLNNLLRSSITQLNSSQSQQQSETIINDYADIEHGSCCGFSATNKTVVTGRDNVIKGALGYSIINKQFFCMKLGTIAEIHWLVTDKNTDDIKKDSAKTLLETIIATATKKHVDAIYFNYDTNKHAYLATILATQRFVPIQNTSETTRLLKKKLSHEKSE